VSKDLGESDDRVVFDVGILVMKVLYDGCADRFQNALVHNSGDQLKSPGADILVRVQEVHSNIVADEQDLVFDVAFAVRFFDNLESSEPGKSLLPSIETEASLSCATCPAPAECR